MDYADKGSRGKWSSLESITSFGWSGSAVLGGIMADHFGYGYTFFATAGLQLISTIILSLGWNLVPPEKCAATQTKSEKDPDSLFEAYDEQLHMNAVAAVRLLQEEEDGSHSHS